MSERQQEKYVSPFKKYGKYRNEEDSDGGSLPRGEKEGGSSSAGKFGKWKRHYDHGGYKPHPAKQEYDADIKMKDVQKNLHKIHTPYTIGHKRRVKVNNEDCMKITVSGNGKPVQENVGEKTQHGALESWFKIRIPYGRKYDKTWLLNSIQSLCSVPFTPVDFHYSNNRAQFFVQGTSASSALMDISYKICDEENQKIVILVSASCVPHSVLYKLDPKEVKELKRIMDKRYDVSQKALDLQCLYCDPGLLELPVDIILNRRSCMAAALQIIKEDFPELLSLNLRGNKLYLLDGLSELIQIAPTVKILNLARNDLKSVWELEKMKGLNLEELWLEGNPLCNKYQDKSTYISAIRKYFPKLLRLDGQVVTPPVTVDVDRTHTPKPCKETCGLSEELKCLVMRFLQEYYVIYDSGDRRGLLAAYHDEACFSLTVPFNPKDPAMSSLFGYFKYNRNMKNFRDPYLRFQLLKHTKQDIVYSLSVLSKTQHDSSSFVVDVWFQTERMLCFSVNGVFKEVEGWAQVCVRAFNRTFIVIPASSSSVLIVNDALFVRDITPKTQSVSSTSSSSTTASLQQQEMKQASYHQSETSL